MPAFKARTKRAFTGTHRCHVLCEILIYKRNRFLVLLVVYLQAYKISQMIVISVKNEFFTISPTALGRFPTMSRTLLGTAKLTVSERQ